MQLEDERTRITSIGGFCEADVYGQMDRKSNEKVTKEDIVSFLGVHRIAASER